ncbi:hypothetical protein TWF696_001304 [Orbilia brochopaga]|uniref:Uncharacterized protein n=1 Tax=Orbilia brochopaga TaxID=3140254 RepID=A0AAV9UCS8_9PEZI
MTTEDAEKTANAVRNDLADLQKENRSTPNFLDIQFTWEKNQQKTPLLDDDKGGNNADDVAVDASNAVNKNLVLTPDYKCQSPIERYPSSPGTPDSSRPGTASSGFSVREGSIDSRPSKSRRDLRRSLFGSKTSLAASLKSEPSIPLPTNILSILRLPEHKEQESIPGIMFNLITKPALEPDTMLKQTAFIYIDRDAVISILTTLEYTHPILSELYLHTQSSLAMGAPRSCESISISDFLEAFMNPAFDPVLTDKLEGYYWSIECSLPNGVIMVHSLQRTTYSHVYIFKFSPVTGVFSKLVPQEIADMRTYLDQHPNDPKMFPKVPAPQMLSDREKLKAQLGGGTSLASRSMTNLANLLPGSLGRKISGSVIASPTNHVGAFLSEGILACIRDTVVPALLNWNSDQVYASNQLEYDLASSSTTTPPEPPKKSNENKAPETPPPSRRTAFLRSTPNSYGKHALQMLRHAHHSTASLVSKTSSSPVAESPQSVQTPAIILTTPERETRILKLSAAVPQTVPQMRVKKFWPPIGGTKKEPPTFVFWKDVFEHLCFGTSVPSDIKSVNMDLDTNINQQVANDLHRLLTVITEMYVKVADGMQLDFVRMKIPPQKNAEPVELRKFYSAQPTIDPQMRDSFSTAPETPLKDKSVDTSEIEQKLGDVKIDKGIEGSAETPGADIRDSITNSESGPNEFNIQEPPGYDCQRDKEVRLAFDIPDLEFSSILMSPDAYIVEAVLAGWFSDAAEWIRHSGSHWRDALLDREADQSASLIV